MTLWTTIRRGLRWRGPYPASFALAAGLLCSAGICDGARAQSPQAAAEALQHPRSLSLTEAELLPDGFVGLPLSASIAAFGGSGVYSILAAGDLPPGVILVRSGNVLGIIGVPTSGGDFQIRVVATDAGSGRSVNRTYSLHVGGQLAQPQAMMATIADPEAFHFTDTDSVFFPAKINDPEGFHFTDADSVFMPAAISDPEGFKFTDTISIFGPDKPSDSEAFHFGDIAVVMTSAMITDPEAFHFGDTDVIATRVGVSPSTAPAGAYKTAFSQVFTAVGNTGAATLTPAGTLPTGLSFTGSGTSSNTLSGTPTQIGTFTFTITAKDTANTSVVSYSLVINKASQSITFPQPTTPVTYYTGETVTLTATSSAGTSYPVSYSVSGPATLSGSTLTYTGAGTVIVTATQAGDSSYNAASPVSVSIVVQSGPNTIFITNGNGTTLSLRENASQQSVATSGGGIGLAVDALGYVWSINSGGAGLTKFNDTGTVAATYSPTGQSSATALTIDGNSNLWITNGSTAVLEVSNAGAAASRATRSTATPATGVAVDQSGSVWVVNGTANTVDKIIGVAAPTAPLPTAVKNGTVGTKP